MFAMVDIYERKMNLLDQTHKCFLSLVTDGFFKLHLHVIEKKEAQISSFLFSVAEMSFVQKKKKEIKIQCVK